MQDYVQALKADKEVSDSYYRFSLDRKTEQQKRLEALVSQRALRPARIADIACGGGGTSLHLGVLYPDAAYSLVDLNEEAVAIAREATRHLNAVCSVGDIYALELESDAYDLVICWQTLSWLNEPQRALAELIRIAKPGGTIYASSLFNAKHDVDIYAKVYDHTRPSTAQGLSLTYNTYCVHSVKSWVAGSVSDVQLHEFEIPIDIEYSGRGLGTYTETTAGGARLQISAGMLLNWGILELRK